MRACHWLGIAWALSMVGACSSHKTSLLQAGTGGSVGVGGKGATSGGSTSAIGGAQSGGAASTPSGGQTSTSGGAGGAATGGSNGPVGGNGGSAGAVSTFDPCPAPGQSCKVLPFGDSITWGYPDPGSGGYRVPLFSRTHQAGKAMTLVGTRSDGPDVVDGVTFPKAHEGEGGASIAQIKDRLSLPEVIALAPHIVLLHAGTNDVEAWAEGLDPNATAEMLAVRLGELLDATVQTFPSALVAVATNIPFRNTGTMYNQKGAPYNALIPQVVSARAAQGKHVILVDQNSAFLADPSYEVNLMADDDHPNSAGYAIMADTWYAAIGALLR
ncbi:MAG: GDSL-type esterase/lipase family protein [Polyangiaceae bacterium]|nr:GDSL-type esterase/lipase family protein [Polyangiaceae bacterium]